MKVWVAEQGCYSGRYMAGVYASAEVAMKVLARPNEKWKQSTWTSEGVEWVEWYNGLDWEEVVRITETEVVETADAPD